MYFYPIVMKLKGYADILRLEYCFHTKNYIFRMVCKEALLFTLLSVWKILLSQILVQFIYIILYTQYYCTYIFGNITVSNYKDCCQNRVRFLAKDTKLSLHCLRCNEREWVKNLPFLTWRGGGGTKAKSSKHDGNIHYNISHMILLLMKNTKNKTTHCLRNLIVYPHWTQNKNYSKL